MRFIILFGLLLFCIAATFAGQESCSDRACSKKFMPVCGQRQVNGKLEKKIFSNECKMKVANECGGGYEPCPMPLDGDDEEE